MPHAETLPDAFLDHLLPSRFVAQSVSERDIRLELFKNAKEQALERTRTLASQISSMIIADYAVLVADVSSDSRSASLAKVKVEPRVSGGSNVPIEIPHSDDEEDAMEGVSVAGDDDYMPSTQPRASSRIAKGKAVAAGEKPTKQKPAARGRGRGRGGN
jgi:hypothetical protein